MPLLLIMLFILQVSAARTNVQVKNNINAGSGTIEVRPRIDSLSTQPQARPPSILDDTDKYDFSRAGSIGGHSARPASIIEEQEVKFHDRIRTFSLFINRSSYCRAKPQCQLLLALMVLNVDQKPPMQTEILKGNPVFHLQWMRNSAVNQTIRYSCTGM